MSCSRGRQAGFTITEVLVVLTILSLTVTVFAVARPGPSPAMQREALITQFIAEAAQARRMAMTSGVQSSIALPDQRCEDSPENLTFFPSGTARAARVCLMDAGVAIWLDADPLTGQITRVDQQ